MKVKILVAGAGGYIGLRLIPVLLELGHEVIAICRSPSMRLASLQEKKKRIQILACDFLDEKSRSIELDKGIEHAYYLIHSMTQNYERFQDHEVRCAENFVSLLQKNSISHLIYLGGLSLDPACSRHMSSRQSVAKILKNSGIKATLFQASIVVGSGSASFEIMRELTEKLPVMLAPRWVKNLCQPIAVKDLVTCLMKILSYPQLQGENYELAGPKPMTFLQMLQDLAQVRGLKRRIIVVPLLTPRLSSLWLYFVSSIDFSLARSLVESMLAQSVMRDERYFKAIGLSTMTYQQAVCKAFDCIEQEAVISSWKDAWADPRLGPHLEDYMKAPSHGCLYYQDICDFNSRDFMHVVKKIWSLGGENGWYYMNWAWSVRGWVDQFMGGKGLRRGRRSMQTLSPGDALDFWRVIIARCHDQTYECELLLFAEMKIPGDAWLEFKVDSIGLENRCKLSLSAIFRPRGIWGRIYWYVLMPVHLCIFKGLMRKLVQVPKS